MSEEEVWFLNRGVLVVRPRDSFVEWVRAMDDSDVVSPEVIRESVNAFLTPDFDVDEQNWEWIRENCEVIFELQLNDWYTDPEMWPEDRSWEAFQSWFELEFIDIAWDLVDEPLSSDPPPSEGNANGGH